MKQRLPRTAVTTTGLLALWLTALPGLAWAMSPPDDGTTSGTASLSSPRKETVKKFLDGCLGKPVRVTNCDTLRRDAVEILKEDLMTLGSTADRAYLPLIVGIFKSDEVELRIVRARLPGGASVE